MLHNHRMYNSLNKHGAVDLLAPPKVPVLWEYYSTVLLSAGGFIADQH